MNYFAHGRRFVDDPYFLAGTAVPDWLNVVDRRVRVRSKRAAPFVEDADPRIAALARGIMRHHHDDAWFHATEAFQSLSWRLTADVRATLGPDDDGMRPSFLGHILVELLLDAALIGEDPSRLDAYYEAFERVDGELIEEVVGRMAGRPAVDMAQFISRFQEVRFLSDYADDGKLWRRLNQVMHRVGLASLPEHFQRLFPNARRLVGERRRELLEPGVGEPDAPVPTSHDRSEEPSR